MGKEQRPDSFGMVSERGAILLIVIIVVLTTSILGATLMALFFNVLSSSQVELDRTRALYLAEAGVSKAISMLKTQAGSNIVIEGNAAGSAGLLPGQIVPRTKLGEGYFEAFSDFYQSTIVAVGDSNGVKRTLQYTYNAF